jgi:hypothetical protein
MSSGCEASGERSDDADDGDGGGGLDEVFEILGRAPVAIEPREGSLGHPASRQDLEAFGMGVTLGDPEA